MENNSKGIAWFGDVYRKIETMCLEVEDILWEEGYSYVEDQVQTVGSNVKQFCSEFVREVLSQSAVGENAACDPSLAKITEGVNKMANGGIVRQLLDKQPSKESQSLLTCSREPIKGAQHDLPLEEHVDALMQEKLEINLMGKFLEENQLYLEMSDKTPHEDNHPSSPVSSSASDDVASKSVLLDAPSSSSAVLADSFKNQISDIKPPSDNGLTGSMHEHFLLDAPSSSSTVLADSLESQISDIKPPSDNDLTGSMRKSDVPINEGETNLLELDCKGRLEESCILVDGRELDELSSSSIEAGRPELSKKKIGASFFAKRRSAKQDWCLELDAGDSQEKNEGGGVVSISAIISTSNQEICESDWEII